MARLALVSALLSEWWSDISRTNFPTSPRIEKVQRNFAFQPGQRYWTALYSLPLTVSASLMEHWWSTLVPFLITTLFASCSYYVHFLFVYVQGFLFHFHFGLHLLLHHRDDTHTHTHTHTHWLWPLTYLLNAFRNAPFSHWAFLPHDIIVSEYYVLFIQYLFKTRCKVAKQRKLHTPQIVRKHRSLL